MSDNLSHADFESTAPPEDSSEPWRHAGLPSNEAVRSMPVLATIDIGALAARLPELGPVLWITRAPRGDTSTRVVTRASNIVLLEHAALAALASCRRIAWHVMVTAQGPREWLEFFDGSGVGAIRMYLLPDTDYFAWDQLASDHATPQRDAPPERWQGHAAFLRNAFARRHVVATARILCLRHRSLPRMSVLDAAAPLRLSLLGLEFAQDIARCEGADLPSPLLPG